MILQILYGFLATAGFAFLFNVPFNAIVVSGLSGAIGWAGYLLAMKIYPSIVAASFIASLFIGIMGEIFAQKKKIPYNYIRHTRHYPASTGSIFLQDGSCDYSRQ